MEAGRRGSRDAERLRSEEVKKWRRSDDAILQCSLIL
jgi:hypothetical protein